MGQTILRTGLGKMKDLTIGDNVTKSVEKILEPIVLAGVVVFLGFVFLIEVMDLFLIRPIYQKLFKKKRRRRRV